MKFLVISHTHHLLPFAYRLQTQGHDVVPIVVIPAFEAAWRGRIKPSPRTDKGRLVPEFLEKLLQQAYTDGDTVITDDWKIQERFLEIDALKKTPVRLFGVFQQHHTTEGAPMGQLRIGAWCDGENLWGHHLLVVDRGAWDGGMGPATDGALTMIRVDSPETIFMLDQLTDLMMDKLRPAGFRGLVQFNLNFRTGSGDPEVDGMTAGWPFLHTSAFVSEIEDFAGLLSTAKADIETPQELLPKKFVTVLPMSRPPWPTRKARFRFEKVPVEGLTKEHMARVFWHDVPVDAEAGKLTTAGLDGLIGVARGAGDTSELARVLALEVALRISLPEKQFRSDAGSRVQALLAELEGRFGVLL